MRIKALLLATALSACSFAPDYTQPEISTGDAQFKEQNGWVVAQPADDIDRKDWWKIYNDKQLDELEAQVTDANQSLKAAVARFDEARAESYSARADYFPTVTANAGYSRTHNSKSTANVAPNNKYNDYSAGLDLSYEIDVWGRVRNAVSAAESREDASAADLATVNLSLHAELAADYFALRGDDASQTVLDEAVESYQKALDLTKRRFAGGASAEADVDQAETQLQNAKTQAADMHLKRQQLEHAIAVLVGKVPSEFQITVEQSNSKLPSIDPGVSTTLLQRRPDIASAERLTAAANAEIGVARAAWFPSFDITGLLGLESASASNLFKAPSRYWSLGPSAVLTVFDAGRIDALNDEARAEYNEAAANYRQTVLNAYQEVEDNLVAIHQLEKENQSQEAATNAAERNLAQANNRYVGGVTTYLDVVVAQNLELQAKLASIDITTKRITASVQLVKALGGGWQSDSQKESEDNKAENAGSYKWKKQ